MNLGAGESRSRAATSGAPCLTRGRLAGQVACSARTASNCRTDIKHEAPNSLLLLLGLLCHLSFTAFSFFSLLLSQKEVDLRDLDCCFPPCSAARPSVHVLKYYRGQHSVAIVQVLSFFSPSLLIFFYFDVALSKAPCWHSAAGTSTATFLPPASPLPGTSLPLCV